MKQTVKEKINIRIKGNTSFINEWDISVEHKLSLLNENDFLRELLDDLYAE